MVCAVVTVRIHLLCNSFYYPRGDLPPVRARATIHNGTEIVENHNRNKVDKCRPEPRSMCKCNCENCAKGLAGSHIGNSGFETIGMYVGLLP